jgi:hypothetical protein
MIADVSKLVARWGDGDLSEGEMRRLTDALSTAEGRAALRQDWFLDAALPQALRTLPLLKMTPQVSLLARVRAWATHLWPEKGKHEEEPLVALCWWARGSLAALPIALAAALWLARPQHRPMAEESEAALVTQIILQRQFTEGP